MPNIKTAEEAAKEYRNTLAEYLPGYEKRLMANSFKEGFESRQPEVDALKATTSAAEIERLRERVKELEDEKKPGFIETLDGIRKDYPELDFEDY